MNEPASHYSDFSAPTTLRQDRLIVEDRTLYVNMGYLSELSTHFAHCVEQCTDPVVVKNATYEEVLELLRVVFYCPQRKPINHSNIVTVVAVGTLLDVGVVLRHCDDFIVNHVAHFTNRRLFQLTQVMATHRRNSFAMSVLLDRLSRMNDAELSSLPFESLPGDVVADIYSLKLRESQRRRPSIGACYQWVRNWCGALSL
ncbi:Protein CYK-7 b [Aphelenchoides avenae]|nr:Protein CYK-7 b [Aphelenchus avenae]